MKTGERTDVKKKKNMTRETYIFLYLTREGKPKTAKNGPKRRTSLEGSGVLQVISRSLSTIYIRAS